MSTIKLNSTYLEIAEKYYAMRGWLSMGMLAVSSVCIFFIGLFSFDTVQNWDRNIIKNQQTDAALAYLFAVFLLGALLAFAIWVLRKEAFWFTHLPARLNRKTRTIHLFRPDRSGTILTVPWDKVFFTLGRGQSLGHWDVRGHVLADDGLELTLLHGHLIVVKQGVQDAPSQSAIPSAISPTDDRFGSHWAPA